MNQEDLLRRRGRASFLAIYFALPSYLQRQVVFACLHGLLCLSTLVLVLHLMEPEIRALALGLVFPGVGFLHWATEGQSFVALVAFAGALLLFSLAILAWFATGNVLLPPLVWIGTSAAAANPTWFGLQAEAVSPLWLAALPLTLAPAGPILIAAAQWRRRKDRIAGQRNFSLPPPVPVAQRREIALDDLKRLRVLLDRALQPVARFDGFEWRDQFQTAAVRYQINFMSYALSMAQANYLPAATAYIAEAQGRLIAKLGDKRIWSYWALENAWGNLRCGRDPLPRGNIMFTGFTCLQMALSGSGASLTLREKGEVWRCYDLREIADILATQYHRAPSSLLACEPNWIYPLCNLITACGLRATDGRDGRSRWKSIAERFRTNLLREFTTGSGDFVAFRSSLTGIAPTPVGGAVMQAFPCLFLNALYPDLAEEHWQRLRHKLAKQDWRRAFWPIDVGNYAISRASSYAASAAAAVEIGDGETALALLAKLEDECPSVTMEGVTHRDRASLWSHDLELAARLGRHNGLRGMVQGAAPARQIGLSLIDAPYPDVLVARATNDGASLDLVLYPGGSAARARIAIAGLCPKRDYRTGLTEVHVVQANELGRAQIDVPLHGRTALSIAPVI